MRFADTAASRQDRFLLLFADSSKSREFRLSASPRFPVDFALFISFSNNTHVESLGFSRVRGIAISPTPVFLEENAVF
jgi:hypothetical protein